MKLKFLLLVFSVFWFDTILSAQTVPVNRSDYQLKMEAINTTITIDGVLDEVAWQNAEVADQFHRILPIDEGYAISQSEVRMSYDKTTVYIAITCFDTIPGKRPVESLRRDFSFGKNDNFICFIDTYNDQTNGFAFGISAAGAQWEGIQANGGFVSLNWDTKWKSAVKSYEDKWIAEFAIPLRSIRYKEGATEWGINFSRLDLKTNEKSSWAPVPRQFQSANLAFTGTVKWDEPLPKKEIQYSLIPYVSAKVTQDREANEDPAFAPGIGMDAKIMLSTSMNLDLTVNPDYSNVEVDRQITNLDRFELFFPEKRQFFLENSDLFASLGDPTNRPFFSRRIGLDAPVIAGARLSGKINENLRIGVMDMQTGSQDSIPASNFGVLTLQQKVLSRSNLSFFFVNKQVNSGKSDIDNGLYAFNRVAGTEFNLASADNRWTGKAYYHHSFYTNSPGDAASMAANIAYATGNLSLGLNNSWISSDYRAEVGFVRRKGVYRVNPEIGYRFFSSYDKIAFHGPKLATDFFLNADGGLTDRFITASYGIDWLNRSQFRFVVSDNYIKLLETFDPTNSGGLELEAGSSHSWSNFNTSFNSDGRKLFNYSVGAGYGGYFNPELSIGLFSNGRH